MPKNTEKYSKPEEEKKPEENGEGEETVVNAEEKLPEEEPERTEEELVKARDELEFHFEEEEKEGETPEAGEAGGTSPTETMEFEEGDEGDEEEEERKPGFFRKTADKIVTGVLGVGGTLTGLGSLVLEGGESYRGKIGEKLKNVIVWGWKKTKGKLKSSGAALLYMISETLQNIGTAGKISLKIGWETLKKLSGAIEKDARGEGAPGEIKMPMSFSEMWKYYHKKEDKK